MRYGRAVALAVALLVVSGTPVAGANNFHVSGAVATELEYRKVGNVFQLVGESGVEIELDVPIGGGPGSARAVVELEPWHRDDPSSDQASQRTVQHFPLPYPGRSDESDPGQEETGPGGSLTGAMGDAIEAIGGTDPFVIKKVYVQTDGALWNGGPDLSARIGDLDVHMNDWIAYREDTRGVSLAGLSLGPVDVGGFYVYPREADEFSDFEPDAAIGLTARGAYAGVDLGATVVSRDQDREFFMEAGSRVADGLHLSGSVARDRKHTFAYRLNVQAELLPDTTFFAGYRATDGFRPLYAKEDEDNDYRLQDYVAFDRRNGLNIGVRTRQAGLQWGAEYDHPKRMLSASAGGMYEQVGLAAQIDTWRADDAWKWHMSLEATRPFALHQYQLLGSYKAEFKQDEEDPDIHPRQELRLATQSDLHPRLHGLNLAAGLVLHGFHELDYVAEVLYESPNGLNVGAHYESEDDKGFFLSAGMKMEF